MRAIIGGALANKPLNGGAAWTRLSWLLGLRRLGFEVHFVEQMHQGHCADLEGKGDTAVACSNHTYFRSVLSQLGLEDCGTLLCGPNREHHGLSRAELLDLAAGADLLVNLSGHLTIEPLKTRARRKAYIDLDPGFTQFWHAAGLLDRNLAGHDSYFTIGENMGDSSCPLPTGGLKWHSTRQPVVLERWPVCEVEMSAGFTTIASWRGPYAGVQHGSQWLGLKAHEHRRFIDLPEQSEQSFEIALDIDPADGKDRELLRAHGWRIVNPARSVPDPISFQHYIQASSAEFSVAKGMYVHTKSGWFSDRTTRYLASGKPAVVQDTGFSRRYPTGDGLLAFRTKREAIAAVHEIERNYTQHCVAARSIAETCFDSDRVLTHFLETAL